MVWPKLRMGFLTRGHGYGHATVDVHIIEYLQQRNLDIVVGSSGTGAEYYRDQTTLSFIDLGIPDEDDQGYLALERVSQFVGRLGPFDFMVADEVFWVPIVCQRERTPNVLITRWCWSEIGLPQYDQSLAMADRVLLLDFPDAHVIPEPLVGKTICTGPLVPRRWSSELKVHDDGELKVVVSFGSVRPDKLPDLTQMLRSIAEWWNSSTRLLGTIVILAEERDFPGIEWRDQPTRVQWLGRVGKPEEVFAVADVHICYDTANTMWESIYNGLPTIAFMGTINPVDQLIGAYLERVGCVSRLSLTSSCAELDDAIAAAVREKWRVADVVGGLPWGSTQEVGDRILATIEEHYPGRLMSRG